MKHHNKNYNLPICNCNFDGQMLLDRVFLQIRLVGSWSKTDIQQALIMLICQVKKHLN